MNQSLNAYKIFHAVASAGNISIASKNLFISQPAISKSISKLEQSLNVTLFNRNSRGVTLTEEGALLYNHIKMAFDAIDSGEEQLKRMNELGIGHLRIGVSTTLCKFLLLPYLKSFIEKHPHIKITIECQSSNHTLELLSHGKIDVGLIGKPEQLNHMDFYSLGEIQDIFAASPAYMENLKQREGSDSIDVFRAATLMLLDKENMTRQYIDDYLIENHIKANNLIEITTMDLLIEFARIGLGIACVIKEFVTTDLARKHLIEIPLGFPIHKREIGFAYQKNIKAATALQLFVDFYKNFHPK